MKLRNTVLAEEILNKQSLKQPFKSFLGQILRWLKHYFGSKILIEVPENLQTVAPKLYGAIDTASKLQRLGIIKKVQKMPKFSDSPFLHVYFSEVGNGRSWGQSFADEEQAFWSCIAEATERSLWSQSSYFFEKKAVRSSFSKVKDSALDINSLAGFTEEQKKDIPCLSSDSKNIFGWLPVRSLTQNREIFCPVQLVSSNYFYKNVQTPQNPARPEKMLRWCVSTGLATGRSLEEAVVKGILEVIERDAFMITYLNKLSPPKIDLENLAEQDGDISKVLEKFKRYNFEVHLLQLPTDLPVRSYLCILVDRTGVGLALSLGARVGFEPKQDILATLAEALMIFSSSKIPPNKKIDPSKPLGQHERVIYWSNLAQLPKIGFLLEGDNLQLDLSKNFFQTHRDDVSRQKYFKDKLAFLVKNLKRKKYEACYAEITTPEVKKLGLRSIFAVIPELQPLHLIETIPYFGGKRLREVPTKLGYEPSEELNKEPQPFP